MADQYKKLPKHLVEHYRQLTRKRMRERWEAYAKCLAETSPSIERERHIDNRSAK